MDDLADSVLRPARNVLDAAVVADLESGRISQNIPVRSEDALQTSRIAYALTPLSITAWAGPLIVAFDASVVGLAFAVRRLLVLHLEA